MRPLKVVFNNKKQRKDILDNAAKLEDIIKTHYLSRCIIAKDLTFQQRQQNIKRRSARVKQVPKQKIAVTPVRTTYTPMITEQLSAHKYAVGGIIVFHGRN